MGDPEFDESWNLFLEDYPPTLLRSSHYIPGEELELRETQPRSKSRQSMLNEARVAHHQSVLALLRTQVHGVKSGDPLEEHPEYAINPRHSFSDGVA